MIPNKYKRYVLTSLNKTAADSKLAVKMGRLVNWALECKVSAGLTPMYKLDLVSTLSLVLSLVGEDCLRVFDTNQRQDEADT